MSTRANNQSSTNGERHRRRSGACDPEPFEIWLLRVLGLVFSPGRPFRLLALRAQVASVAGDGWCMCMRSAAKCPRRLRRSGWRWTSWSFAVVS